MYGRIKEAALCLWVHPNTVKRWIRAGKVRARRRGSLGHWRIYFPPLDPLGLPNDLRFYVMTGLAGQAVRRWLRDIAVDVALRGAEEVANYFPHYAPVVAAVVKRGLHKQVRPPKVYRLYRPGGKVREFSERKVADLVFAWCTFFDGTNWEDPFSWDRNEPDAVKTKICHRINNVWKDMYPEELEDQIPEDIMQLRDNDAAFANYAVNEYLNVWIAGGMDGPNNIPRASLPSYLPDDVLETIAASVHPAKSLSPEGFRLLASLAPDETWAREVKPEEIARVFKELLILTDKQRGILTAMLILRQKASRTGESISKGDIRWEMENQWCIRMSPSALANHFKRVPILQRLFHLQNNGLPPMERRRLSASAAWKVAQEEKEVIHNAIETNPAAAPGKATGPSTRCSVS